MNETGHPNRPVLREVAAKNLLSFGPEGLRLEIKPLNVLIGPNGSGKSNLFEALGLLKAAPAEIAKPIREGGGHQELALAKATVGRGCGGGSCIRARSTVPITSHDRVHGVGPEIHLIGEKVENRVLDPKPDEPDILYSLQNGSSILSERHSDDETSIRRWEGLDAGESILSEWGVHAVSGELTVLRSAYLSISLYRDWQFGQVSVLRKPQNTDVRRSPLARIHRRGGVTAAEWAMSGKGGRWFGQDFG